MVAHLSLNRYREINLDSYKHDRIATNRTTTAKVKRAIEQLALMLNHFHIRDLDHGSYKHETKR
jgi:hypothetical protein